MRNWKIRDFVLIGLLAAVEAAVIYGVGMLTAVLAPIMHIFGPSITAFIMGTVALFIVKRVRRFGAMTLFQSLGIALFTLTGMGSVVCLICVVIVSLIADILITKTNFKTISVAVGHGLAHAAYFFGGCFPMLFFLEREINRWVEMGLSEEAIQEYVKYFTGGFVALGTAAALICGVLGVYVGKTLLKRHFKDMD